MKRVFIISILLFAANMAPAQAERSNGDVLADLIERYGSVEAYKKHLCTKRVPRVLNKALNLRFGVGEKSAQRALEVYALRRVGGRRGEGYKLTKKASRPIFSYVYNAEGSYAYIRQMGIADCWDEKRIIPSYARTILRKAREAKVEHTASAD